MKQYPLLIILAIMIIIGTYAGQSYYQRRSINSFEKCAAAGYPVQESYPERCTVPGGQTFTKLIDGQSITITGEFTCLPHKRKEGPQTLECAFGLKTADGHYYGLNDPTMQHITSAITGKQITVTGVIDGKQSPADSIYDIIGTIIVSEIQDH